MSCRSKARERPSLPGTTIFVVTPAPALPRLKTRSAPMVCLPRSNESGGETKEARPRLILAPMEILGDAQFRLGMSSVGGFDEAVHEFIRIPHGAQMRDVKGILRHRYKADELAHAGIPLAAQIMCGCPGAAADATGLLVARDAAPRVDLNCGCPSKRANSRHNGPGTAAGASLLDEPQRLHDVAKAMVEAAQSTEARVSVKMRTGMNDLGRFEECVCAARDAGVSMIAVHGRTRKQGYKGMADWSTVSRAVALCKDHGVEVIGNGDCVSGEDVVRRAAEVGCDGVMVGRGAVVNCDVFWEARRLWECSDSDSAVLSSTMRYDLERQFLKTYFAAGAGVSGKLAEPEMDVLVAKEAEGWAPRRHIEAASRIKMMLGHAAWADEETRDMIRRTRIESNSLEFLEMVLQALGRSLCIPT